MSHGEWVRLAIGSVASSAVLAWTEHGRKVLEELPGREDVPFELPPETVRSLRTLLDEWMWLADGTVMFEWSCELEEIQVRTLVQYWLNIASYLARGGGYGGLKMSEEAKPFEHALLAAVVEAFADDDFGRRLQEMWPCREFQAGRS